MLEKSPVGNGSQGKEKMDIIKLSMGEKVSQNIRD